MRSIRSSNPNDYNYNRRINGLIRLKEIKIGLYGELEVRNKLFPENQAKDCQEIEELRRICCEETDRARQARIDEFLDCQVSILEKRMPNSLNCERE